MAVLHNKFVIELVLTKIELALTKIITHVEKLMSPEMEQWKENLKLVGGILSQHDCDN